MVKQWHTKTLIFVVCLILGFMIMMQFKSHHRYTTVTLQRAEELTVRLKAAEEDRDKLARELEKIKSGKSNVDIRKELQMLKALAGETPLEGKGVEVYIDDSTLATKPGENQNLYIIHDEDLLRVVNELRAAGAEAISLNGQRLTSISEIRCVGPTVLVNETRVAAPFSISAIGNPQTLESALKIRGGVLDNFKFWGIRADVKKSDKVKVPAAKKSHSFEFAKAVVEPEKKKAEQQQSSAKNTDAEKSSDNKDTKTEKDTKDVSIKNFGTAKEVTDSSVNSSESGKDEGGAGV